LVYELGIKSINLTITSKKMKSIFLSKIFTSSIARILLFAGIITTNLLVASFAQAEEKRNDVGFGVQFGNSTNFGIQGKIGVSDNFSLRPEIFFGSGSSVENSSFTSPVEFLSPVPVTSPTSLTLPALVNVGTLNVPLTTASNFTTPAAFTTNIPVVVGGNTFPAGTTIPAGTVIPSGTTVPAGTTFPVGFTIPAGTILKAGTVVPANTRIPAGLSLPAGTIGSRLSGTSFGLAATYDFKLDPQGKSTAYIGPKVSFASASGPATINGADVPGSKLDISDTKIGIVAGADYGISDNFTIGANVTYNLSRSVSGSGSFGVLNTNVNNFIQPAGSSLDFGVRASYRF
jgi:opacity protein-like surface antigen